MVQQVKGLAIKPDDLSLILCRMVGENYSQKVVSSPPLHVLWHCHAYTHTHTHTSNKCNKLEK